MKQKYSSYSKMKKIIFRMQKKDYRMRKVPDELNLLLH
jgi:hypothetical protein